MSAATELMIEEQTRVPPPLATPGRRLAAYAIDVGAVAIAVVLATHALGIPSAFSLAEALGLLFYFAGFEGSRLQGSPGKMLVGLKVVSDSGGPISFRQALARNVAKLPTAGLGFIVRMIRSRAAWHDLLASTAVVRRGFEPAPVLRDDTSSRAGRLVGWTIVGVVFALLVGNGFKRAFTLSVTVYGNDMAPTYSDGSHLTIEKFSYLLGSPQHGDVILFRAASAGYPHNTLLGRVIGLPGDTVQVRTAVVLVNGHVLYEPYEQQPPDYSWGPETVPPGRYFVLADNRNDAFDSHNWPISPWVARDEIVGKVWF
jgi:signal peptidase I